MIKIKDNIKGFASFLEAWNNPHSISNKSFVSVKQSDNGKINTTGTCNDYSAPTITRWHFQFNEVLEPGIKRLVLMLINELDWITFSSCEGHFHNNEIDPRRVGIMGRNLDEVKCIEEILIKAVDIVNAKSDCIKLVIQDSFLVEDDKLYPAVHIIFDNNKGDDNSYFQFVDYYTDEFIASLRKAAKTR